MTAEKVMLCLDPFEQRLLVQGMNQFRNDLLKDEKPVEDVDAILLRIIDAPPMKKRREEREER